MSAKWLAPCGLLIAFATLAVSSMSQESITGDEIAHLPAGYSYIKTGDFRLNMQHPPLIKALAAMPLLFLDLKPVDDSPAWQAAQEWDVGRDFLLNNRQPFRTIIFLARLPMVGVGILLGLLLFLWGRDLWGYWPGVFVLFLYTCCPNFLGHTGLVTTDVGVACFTVMALYALWRFGQRLRRRDAVLCGLALGLALLAKYSGVLTALLVVLLLVALVLNGAPIRSIVRSAVLIAFLAALLVTVGFGFPYGLVNYRHGFSIIHADLNPYWEGFLWGEYSKTGFWYYYLLGQWWKTPIPTLLFFFASLFLVSNTGARDSDQRTSVPQPKSDDQFPPPYGTVDFRHVNRSLPLKKGGQEGFDDESFEQIPLDPPFSKGEVDAVPPQRHLSTVPYEGGGQGEVVQPWQPAAHLLLRKQGLDWLFVLLPIVVFHGAGMWLRASIGVRHIMPVFPFLFLAAGAVARCVSTRQLVYKAAFALLCAWSVVGMWRVYPHFLAYFNELAGGPDNGIYYLDDSNIEWAQDFFGLKRYIDTTHPKTVRILAFEPIRPAKYGIEDYDTVKLKDAAWPEPGVTYFVGASYLQRSSLFNDYPGVRFRWLERYRPIDKIGWSILVYRFSTDPADEHSAAVFYVPKDKWYDDAVEQLEAILSRSPQFDYARSVLAEVYLDRAAWQESQGHAEAALLDYLNAVRTAPQTTQYRQRFRDAANRLQAALHSDDGVPAPIYCNEGLVHLRAQNPGQAIVSLMKCLNRDGGLITGHLNLGNIYAQLGFPGLAREQWERCLTIDPSYQPARRNLEELQRQHIPPPATGGVG